MPLLCSLNGLAWFPLRPRLIGEIILNTKNAFNNSLLENKLPRPLQTIRRD